MNLHAFLEFIIINFALIFFSLSIVAHFHRLKSINFLDLVLKSSSLFFSFILLTQISLGAFGLLTYKNLLSLLFVLSLFFLFSPIKDSLKKLQVNYNTKELSPWQLLALPLFVIFFIRFINALLQIPLEYDNVAYHLPFVVEWFKTGDLMTPYYSAFASPIGYYPSNFELFDLWLLFPFKNDLLINLINFPIVVLAIACLYGLCRNFSFNKSVSSLVALLPFYMPVFLKQVGLPLVDLFFSLCFLLCIYFLQKIYKSPKSKALPLPLFAYFGLSLGLFMGTKYLGLVYGILLVPVLIHAAFYKRKKAKRSWIATSIAAGTSFLTGAFFYIRNWIDSGNPLFPVEINLLGQKIFPGYMGMNEKVSATSLLENVKDFQSLEHFLRHFYYMTGLQSGVIAIGIALASFFAFKSWQEKNKAKSAKKTSSKNTPATITIFIVASIIYFVLYFKSPYSWRDLTPNVRYAIVFLLTGSICFGFALQKLEEKHKSAAMFLKLISIIAIYHAVVKFVITPPDYILYNDRIVLNLEVLKDHKLLVLINLIRLALAGILGYFLVKKSYPKALMVLVVILFNVLYTLQISAPARENLSTYFYKDWYEEDPEVSALMDASTWLDQNHPYARVAYTGFNFHYHLFGRDLQREVHYININECLDCRYKDYADSKNSIRRDPDYQNWINNLEAKNKTHIVIEPNITTAVHSYELEWAQENPNKFKEVFRSGNSYIFEIK